MSEALPIGETNSNIFSCPACARPLGSRAARCPGCGTRLIVGVQAGRALGLVAIGVVVGLVVGGGLISIAATLSRGSSVASAGSTTTLRSAPPAATAAPLATPPPDAGPLASTAARSALRQTALVNQRIATGAVLLTGTLAAGAASSADITRALRSRSSNALSAQGIAAEPPVVLPESTGVPAP